MLYPVPRVDRWDAIIATAVMLLIGSALILSLALPSLLF